MAIMTESTPHITPPESETGKLAHGIRRLFRYVFKTILGLLLVVTVYLTAGRLLMTMVQGQKVLLESELSEMTSTEVTLASLRGDWFRFSPLLELDGLKISFPDQEVSHFIQGLKIKLDVMSTIFHRGLVIEQVTLDKLAIEFVEDQEGHWSFAGFSEGDTDYTEEMLDLVLNIANLQLSEARLIFHRATGSPIVLNNAYVQLQNFEQEHHLQIQLRLEEQASPLRFSLVIDGDPRAEYTASAYFWLNEIDFTSLLETSEDREFVTSELGGSAQVWVDYDQNAKWQIRAELNNFNVEGHSMSSDLAFDITSGSANITALQGENKQWQVWLNNPQFDLYGWPWESGDFFLDLDLRGEAPGIELVGDRVDLNLLGNMLGELSLPENGRRVLEQLQPSGALTNIKFSTDFSGNYPDGFELSANIVDVAVGAWSAAPSMQGVNGYVHANQVSGYIELDSRDFDIHLPKVFNDGWHYDFINSRVHWYVTNEVIRVNSGVIDAQNEGIHGRVQFELSNTRHESGGWNSELSILVGALKFDASQKSLYLPTLPNIRATMSWLDQALLGGDVTNSGFIFRGITAGDGAGSNTIQTFYNVENGVLKFLPEWPVLENINAYVKVSNNDVEISAESAVISDIVLGSTQGTIRLIEPGALPETAEGSLAIIAEGSLSKTAEGSLPETAEGSLLITAEGSLPITAEGSWLSIKGKAQTTTALGLDFIRNSPVQGFVGSYVNNWRAEGLVDVDIELGIPLNNDSLANSIQVAVMSNSSVLEMPDYGLTFEEIRGEVSYSSETGLSASALTGTLFDFPIVSSIATFDNSQEGTNISESGTRFLTTGRASVNALKDWTGQTEFVKKILQYTSGEIDYVSEFELFNGENQKGVLSRLTLASELPGLKIDLPSPFNKDLDDSRRLELETEFLSQQEVYSVRYDGSFYTQVNFINNELAGGEIFFGPLTQEFELGMEAGSGLSSLESQQGFQINGELEYLNFDDWYKIGQSFSDDTQTGPSIEEFIDIVDVDIANFKVSGMDLLQINTQVSRSEEGWNVFLESDLVRGQFDFPDDTQAPLEIDLDYLRFPEDEDSEIADNTTHSEIEIVPEEEIDVLENIDPGELPNINFSTLELKLGKRNLGAWEFALRPNGSGATISNLKMTGADASITDMSGSAGANLDWHYVNGVHTSSFNGLLHAGDLSQVLPSWGYDANVQSENADFVSNLQWPGSPVFFAVKALSGQMDIKISNGRFVDINSDSVRIFAAFNFDAIERRLQLDFSDLYEKGLSYDTISGKLNFNNGIINTDGRFLIQGTSSTINIEGEMDLINQTINADMLVNIPLSQNIAVIAGILGAWPIAIGSYLAGKIFEEQLQPFTTVLYRLEGPWSELDAGFESDDSVVENELEETGLQ